MTARRGRAVTTEPGGPVTRLLYALLAMTGGALLAAQAPINARLRVALGSPVGSALVSFAVGTIVLCTATLVAGDIGKTARGIGDGPWWAYLGGICGSVLVFATLTASPRVGVTTTFVSVIFGQVVLAALIDRFGWFGAKVQGFTTGRGVAIGLLLISLVLLLRE
jgi:bacterial/archaeal transporter family-2 protein